MTTGAEAQKRPAVAVPPPSAAATRGEAPAPSAVPVADSPAPQTPPNAGEGSTSQPKPPPSTPVEAAPTAVQDPAEPSAAAPPKKAVASGPAMNLYEVDKPPAAVSRPTPLYTNRAKALRQEGSVFLNLLVDEKGKVTDVQLIQGIPDSDLNDAAIRTVRTWVYEPAIKDGTPVKVWKFEKINFTLGS